MSHDQNLCMCCWCAMSDQTITYKTEILDNNIFLIQKWEIVLPAWHFCILIMIVFFYLPVFIFPNWWTELFALWCFSLLKKFWDIRDTSCAKNWSLSRTTVDEKHHSITVCFDWAMMNDIFCPVFYMFVYHPLRDRTVLR